MFLNLNTRDWVPQICLHLSPWKAYGNTALTSIAYTEYIALEDDNPSNRTLDLLMYPAGRDFTIIPDETINDKKVIKSMLLIERIR